MKSSPRLSPGAHHLFAAGALLSLRRLALRALPRHFGGTRYRPLVLLPHRPRTLSFLVPVRASARKLSKVSCDQAASIPSSHCRTGATRAQPAMPIGRVRAGELAGSARLIINCRPVGLLGQRQHPIPFPGSTKPRRGFKSYRIRDAEFDLFNPAHHHP